jgi:hypothetical protein
MLAHSPQAWFERGHAARRARTPAAATLRARESRFVRAQRAKCEGSKPPNESRGARASLCGGRASPRTFVPFRGNARTYLASDRHVFFFRAKRSSRAATLSNGNEADRRVLAGRGASR